ncbi:MAG: twin arginine-targeting protein translocase TatB [Lysobacterales bacterium 14-68-21]|jgi:sec-independent protein translocase protein TatB|nr:MAG: twin arginine-targeting protein translocase TatB [Xanthomonadales bacterium 15-68-25]OZB67674.1 MAG: twin arginine-targeting protein translocase TatB [Xanthomonadales bacterium 14-68-21]
MIEISFGKLLLLAVIALIVLGPEKLPVAARTAGTLLRRLRSGWDSVRAEVERELQVEEIRRAAREAAAQAEAAQARLDEVQAKVDEAARQAGKVASADVSTLADAPAPASAPAAPDGPALMTGKPKDDPSTPPQDEVPRGQG